MDRNTAKNLIKDTIKSSISSYARNSLGKTPKFQILDLIIPKERKIRSIVGGMETSLGTTLWEPLAKALASGNGFTVINSDLPCPFVMPAGLKNTLDGILEDRMQRGVLYDAKSSHDEIRRVCQAYLQNPIDRFVKAPTGYGVDIWLEKNNINYFFDTKTVQPSLGDFGKYLRQLLTWYAYFYSRFPQGQAAARIVFPYNPHNDRSFWDGATGNGRPLEPLNEGLVENEFWDFCSGLPNTFQLIKESFTEVQESKELETILDNLMQ